MTDNLRAQFTEVLAGAANSQRTWQGVLDCGLLADAVIRELQLAVLGDGIVVGVCL